MALTPAEEQELAELEAWAAQNKAPDEQWPDVIQEQHPDIGVGERALLKNLGTQQGISDYLKQKGFEVTTQGDQFAVRKPGEKEFRVLDPSSRELADLGDIAYDIPAGLASAVAGTAAAVGAAPGTWVVGSLPAAMAASGVVSTGLEGLRQKLGQYMGIPQEVSGSDVATAGALGAASPLVFGTGASASKLAPELMRSQRGVISRGLDTLKEKALPAMGELFSGADKEAIKTIAKNPQAIAELDDPVKYNELAVSAYDKLREGLSSYKTKIGQQLEEAVTSATEKGQPSVVNLGPVKSKIDDLIAKMSSSDLSKTPAKMDEIAELKSLRDQIFKESTGQLDEAGNPILQEMDNLASPTKAFQLQELLSDYANLPKTKEGLQSRLAGTRTEKQWQEANRSAYNEINSELNRVTEGLSGDLKGKYAKYSKLQKELNTKFKSPEATARTLETFDNKQFTKGTLANIKAETGIDISPEASLFKAHKMFPERASKMPISSKGSVSTGRIGAAGLLGYTAGSAFGGPAAGATGAYAANLMASPWAIKNIYAPVAHGYQQNISPIAQKIAPAANPAAQSLWNLILKKEKGVKNEGNN